MTGDAVPPLPRRTEQAHLDPRLATSDEAADPPFAAFDEPGGTGEGNVPDDPGTPATVRASERAAAFRAATGRPARKAP